MRFMPLALLTLTACEAAPPVLSANSEGDDVIAARIAGTTIVNENGVFNILPGGSLTGRLNQTQGDVTGTWEIRNGQWCRTIAEPMELSGTQCQEMTLTQTEVVLTRPDGVQVSYAVQ